MSFADFQERLARSIKIVDLPPGYDKEEILNNLRNAGSIDDIKTGISDMIVTFASADQKDLSKMYDGCAIGDYTLKFEDPTSFDVSGEQSHHHQEKNVEPEIVHHEPPRHEPVHEPVYQPVYEPVHEEKKQEEHHEPPQHHEAPHHHEPPQHEVIQHHEASHEEPVQLNENIQKYIPAQFRDVEPTTNVQREVTVEHRPEENMTITRIQETIVQEVHIIEKVEKVDPHVERKPETIVIEKTVVVEKKPEVHTTTTTTTNTTQNTERKSEVAHNVERKSEVTHSASSFGKSGDSSKDLLRELQNTNLPARAGLPSDDLFKTVTQKGYLLIFTMVWGLQLFLRSVF